MTKTKTNVNSIQDIHYPETSLTVKEPFFGSTLYLYDPQKELQMQGLVFLVLRQSLVLPENNFCDIKVELLNLTSV